VQRGFALDVVKRPTDTIEETLQRLEDFHNFMLYAFFAASNSVASTHSLAAIAQRDHSVA
jgi:hypothetical protein